MFKFVSSIKKAIHALDHFNLKYFKNKVPVQAPFRHRHRFKSIDLAPVSDKTQTIPNPNFNSLKI